MIEKELVLDLNKPEDARTFLRNIKGRREDGTEFQINAFQLGNGQQITVDQMTDDQAVYYAGQLHRDLFGGRTTIENPDYIGKKVMKWQKKKKDSSSSDKSTESSPRKTDQEESK